MNAIENAKNRTGGFCEIRWGFSHNRKMYGMSRVVAYFSVRKLRAKPNIHCVLRIYVARNVTTAAGGVQVDLLDWRHISLLA